VSASASKTGHGVSGAFDSAGSSIKSAAHNVGDKVSHAADKVRLLEGGVLSAAHMHRQGPILCHHDRSHTVSHCGSLCHPDDARDCALRWGHRSGARMADASVTALWTLNFKASYKVASCCLP
jgi:hypothetical protein